MLTRQLKKDSQKNQSGKPRTLDTRKCLTSFSDGLWNLAEDYRAVAAGARREGNHEASHIFRALADRLEHLSDDAREALDKSK